MALHWGKIPNFELDASNFNNLMNFETIIICRIEIYSYKSSMEN